MNNVDDIKSRFLVPGPQGKYNPGIAKLAPRIDIYFISRSLKYQFRKRYSETFSFQITDYEAKHVTRVPESSPGPPDAKRRHETWKIQDSRFLEVPTTYYCQPLNLT